MVLSHCSGRSKEDHTPHAHCTLLGLQGTLAYKGRWACTAQGTLGGFHPLLGEPAQTLKACSHILLARKPTVHTKA